MFFNSLTNSDIPELVWANDTDVEIKKDKNEKMKKDFFIVIIAKSLFIHDVRAMSAPIVNMDTTVEKNTVDAASLSPFLI